MRVMNAFRLVVTVVAIALTAFLLWEGWAMIRNVFETAKDNTNSFYLIWGGILWFTAAVCASLAFLVWRRMN